MARKISSSTRPKAADSSGAITDKGAKGVSKAITAATGNASEVPGPSTNPATNLIIHDILLRVSGRLVRHTVEKGILANRYGGKSAKSIIENRSIGQALFGALVARVATRSVPGALVVGGGLVAKTLFDRSQSKRAAKRTGDRTLKKMSED
jgi:hypothetical protein